MRASERFSLAFVPEKLYSYRLHGTNSFKSLQNVGQRQFEVVARGVRERAADRPRGWRGSSGRWGWWLGGWVQVTFEPIHLS